MREIRVKADGGGDIVKRFEVDIFFFLHGALRSPLISPWSITKDRV